MVKESPLFSVIITCYNYEAYVSVAIDSVLRQTSRDFELIVVDDGSSDRSWSIINGYSGRLIPIKTENRGSIPACLTGLAASCGAYVLFLDADDVLADNALSKAAEHLHADVSKIQFRLQPIDAQGNSIGDAFPRLSPGSGSQKMVESVNRLGYYSTPPTSGNIYRRDVYLTLGPIDYDFGIDGVAYLLAPFKGDVIHIDEALGQYRIHGNNLSGVGFSSSKKMERERVVFRQRLEHLARLLGNQPGIDGRRFTLRADYLYRVEREAFAEILQGKRLRFQTLQKYLHQIWTSLFGLERASYVVFGLLLFALPTGAAKSLLDFNINPRKSSRLRIIIKRLVRR
jgi:glycosyltransferase involved in cell wall biosynthesis